MSAADLLPMPDTVDVPCCEAAVYSNGDRCTCWEAVLDIEPTTALQEGPMVALRKACGDCAYRAGSPERAAEDGAIPSYSRHEPFFCHQGVAKVTRWVHPSGAVHFPDGDDYQPVTSLDMIWLADGRPGEYCAGWAAVNRIRS